MRTAQSASRQLPFKPLFAKLVRRNDERLTRTLQAQKFARQTREMTRKKTLNLNSENLNKPQITLIPQIKTALKHRRTCNSSVRIFKDSTCIRVIESVETLEPSSIRFSQSNVRSSLPDIVASMKANGCQGASIDVARMADGGGASVQF